MQSKEAIDANEAEGNVYEHIYLSLGGNRILDINVILDLWMSFIFDFTLIKEILLTGKF